MFTTYLLIMSITLLIVSIAQYDKFYGVKKRTKVYLDKKRQTNSIIKGYKNDNY